MIITNKWPSRTQSAHPSAISIGGPYGFNTDKEKFLQFAVRKNPEYFLKEKIIEIDSEFKIGGRSFKDCVEVADFKLLMSSKQIILLETCCKFTNVYCRLVQQDEEFKIRFPELPVRTIIITYNMPEKHIPFLVRHNIEYKVITKKDTFKALTSKKIKFCDFRRWSIPNKELLNY